MDIRWGKTIYHRFQNFRILIMCSVLISWCHHRFEWWCYAKDCHSQLPYAQAQTELYYYSDLCFVVSRKWGLSSHLFFFLKIYAKWQCKFLQHITDKLSLLIHSYFILISHVIYKQLNLCPSHYDWWSSIWKKNFVKTV